MGEWKWEQQEKRERERERERDVHQQYTIPKPLDEFT
jgi:hypothetical protein